MTSVDAPTAQLQDYWFRVLGDPAGNEFRVEGSAAERTVAEREYRVALEAGGTPTGP